MSHSIIEVVYDFDEINGLDMFNLFDEWEAAGGNLVNLMTASFETNMAPIAQSSTESIVLQSLAPAAVMCPRLPEETGASIVSKQFVMEPAYIPLSARVDNASELLTQTPQTVTAAYSDASNNKVTGHKRSHSQISVLDANLPPNDSLLNRMGILAVEFSSLQDQSFQFGNFDAQSPSGTDDSDGMDRAKSVESLENDSSKDEIPTKPPAKKRGPYNTKNKQLLNSQARKFKLPQQIHDRVITYTSHMLRTFNSGNLQELIGAIDRACSSHCVLRTRLVKNPNKSGTASSSAANTDEDVPFADINVKRIQIVDFFRGISEAFPDGIFQTHCSKVQAGLPVIVATKYSFSGTMIKSVFEDKIETKFDVVNSSVLPRLRCIRPSTQSVLATGTILLTLGNDFKADFLDMNYISNCRIVNAALIG